MRTKLTSLLFVLPTMWLMGQVDLTPDEWRQDLRFLQKTVHTDHSFLFKKISAKDFDTQVDELYEAIPDLADHEVIVGLARIVSSFAYGHTSIWLTGWDPSNLYGFHQMPFNLYHYSDGIYIQGVHKRYKKTLGAKVLKVESIPIGQVLQAIRPVVPVENEQFFKAYGVNYLGTPEVLHAQGVMEKLKTSVTLTLEKDGKIFEQTFAPVEIDLSPIEYGHIHQQGVWLDARDTTETPLWLKNLELNYYFEYLTEHKTIYVRHSQIQDDPEENIPDFYTRVFDFIQNNDVERLILDVRLNGGGNNYKNKSIITSIIRSEKINKSGKFFVILGRRTFSACQNLVNELDTYTEAIFVGEPTAENINFYGDNRLIELPNSKIPARLSFAWWQDKPQWENGPWLAPHLAVDMSFEEYKNNHDPTLEAIWKYDSSSAVVDPWQYLKDLYMAGKKDQVTPEAVRLVNDPRYRYYPFEDRFNQAGYNLLANQQFEPAIFVLTMNNELFPDSANTWDSLAEAYWKAGQIDKAITLYEKAIQMDPDGPTGDNARIMINRIKNEEN